jgi:hypothetical protein
MLRALNRVYHDIENQQESARFKISEKHRVTISDLITLIEYFREIESASLTFIASYLSTAISEKESYRVENVFPEERIGRVSKNFYLRGPGYTIRFGILNNYRLLEARINKGIRKKLSSEVLLPRRLCYWV